MNNYPINKIFDEVVTVASGSDTSAVLDLNNHFGYFTIQGQITGSGTLKYEFIISNNGVDFLAPEVLSDDIITGLTVGSGPGADGKFIAKFEVPFAKFMKIVATETGTSDSVTHSAWVNF